MRSNAGRTTAETLPLSLVREDGLEREPPREIYRHHRRSPRSKPRSATLLTVLLIFALAAGLAYILTRPGLLEQLLPGLLQPPAETAAAPVTVEQPAKVEEKRPAPPVHSRAVARPPMPDVLGLSILVRNAILALGHADVTGNYSVMREMAAPSFQQANSPARLSELFANLRKQKLDLASVAVVNPVLSRPPVIDDQGLLRVAGTFSASTGPIEFQLIFDMVGSRWHLFGIAMQPAGAPNERSAPVDGKTLPDTTTMIELIRNHVVALNQANMTGNYSVLRDMSAPGFQAANSFADLAEIFAALHGRHLDLAPVTVIDPQLYRPPAIEKGLLHLTGFFPSEPERVNFDLAFQVVEGQWRLFGIGLNTSRIDPGPPAEKGTAAPPVSVSQSPAPPVPRPRPQT